MAQDDLPPPKTVHNRLKRLSEADLGIFSKKINDFLQQKLLNLFRGFRKRKRIWIAADAHDIPCYSKKMKKDHAKGKTKASTTVSFGL